MTSETITISCTRVHDVDTDEWWNRWTISILGNAPIEVDVRRSASTHVVVKEMLDRGIEASGDALTNAVSKATTTPGAAPLQVTKRPGWRDGAFLSRGWTVGNSSISLRGAVSQQAGSLPGWRDGLREPCHHSTYMAFAIGVGFASTTLGFLDEHEGALFNLYCDSSAGKSLVSRCSLSISERARPTDLKTYDASARGLEELCFTNSDHQFTLDELSRQEGGPAGMRRLSFMVASGVGRIRSEVATEVPNRTWRVMGLTSSEEPLSKRHTRLGGEQVRHIDIPLPKESRSGGVFNRPGRDPNALAATTEKVLRANYGVALQPFVEYLVKGGESLRLRMLAAIETYVAEQASTGFERRIIRKFAIVRVAMEVAASANIAPWSRDRPEKVTDLLYKRARKHILEPDGRTDVVLERLQDQLARDAFPVLTKGAALSREKLGFVRPGRQRDVLAIEPREFDRLCGARVVAQAVRQKLHQRGILIASEDGKLTRQMAVAGSGRGRGRWVCLDKARVLSVRSNSSG